MSLMLRGRSVHRLRSTRGSVPALTLPDISSRHMKRLSPTAYVILGVLGFHPHSGYGVKKIVDESLRGFWNVSFAQIYPELEKLEKLKLIEPDPTSEESGRRRVVHRLTREGRAELRRWLTEPEASPLEIRDEMLVKLFFSDAMTDIELRTHLQRMREREERVHQTFVAAQAHVDELPHGKKRGPALVVESLREAHAGYLKALQLASRRLESRSKR